MFLILPGIRVDSRHACNIDAANKETSRPRRCCDSFKLVGASHVQLAEIPLVFGCLCHRIVKYSLELAGNFRNEPQAAVRVKWNPELLSGASGKNFGI